MSPDKALTILVVEDDAAVQEMLVAVLEEAGYRIVRAANGVEGCRVLDRLQPALIISDLQMPEMDGFAFYRQVRAQPDLALVPFIFITAFPVAAGRPELAGQVVLHKPFSIEALLDAIDPLLPA